MGILTGKYNDGVPEDSRLGQSKDSLSTGRKKAYGDDDWKKQIAHVKNLKVNVVFPLAGILLTKYSLSQTDLVVIRQLWLWLGSSRTLTFPVLSQVLPEWNKSITVSSHLRSCLSSQMRL